MPLPICLIFEDVALWKDTYTLADEIIQSPDVLLQLNKKHDMNRSLLAFVMLYRKRVEISLDCQY